MPPKERITTIKKKASRKISKKFLGRTSGEKLHFKVSKADCPEAVEIMDCLNAIELREKFGIELSERANWTSQPGMWEQKFIAIMQTLYDQKVGQNLGVIKSHETYQSRELQ